MIYHFRRKYTISWFKRGIKKVCYFTENKVQKIYWKDADLLKRFISDRGKILPRRITGTKAIYQRGLATASKRIRDYIRSFERAIFFLHINKYLFILCLFDLYRDYNELN